MVPNCTHGSLFVDVCYIYVSQPGRGRRYGAESHRSGTTGPTVSSIIL